MTDKSIVGLSLAEPVDYEKLVEMFNQALIHTLRKHSVAGSFLDLWVPDADPVLGLASMIDSARIAGLTDIAVHFRTSTIPKDRLPELERALAAACDVTLEMEGERILLRATHMRQMAASGQAHAAAAPKPTYWQAEQNAGARPDHRPARWAGGDLPEFADVHPHFRPQLKAALDRLSREGNLGEPGPHLVQVTGSEGPVALSLVVDPQTHRVATARHLGARNPAERAVLDLFCKAAENLPIQEVADHVGLKVLDSLVDADKPAPVGGVLLPINAGAPFTLAPRLARKAYDAYRERTGVEDGTNFYYSPAAADWQALSQEDRRGKVDYVLRAFLQSSGLYPDDMTTLRIDKNKYGSPVRVTVGFSERIPVADKPNLMRRLEQRLRRDLEPEIDLVADRARDKSPLRRLS